MKYKQSGGCDGASAGVDLRLMVFYNSPNAGKADCVCSLCLNRIVEGEVPIRVFGKEKGEEGKSIEMRFHQIPCFQLLLPIFQGDYELSGEQLHCGKID